MSSSMMFVTRPHVANFQSAARSRMHFFPCFGSATDVRRTCCGTAAVAPAVRLACPRNRTQCTSLLSVTAAEHRLPNEERGPSRFSDDGVAVCTARAEVTALSLGKHLRFCIATPATSPLDVRPRGGRGFLCTHLYRACDFHAVVDDSIQRRLPPLFQSDPQIVSKPPFSNRTRRLFQITTFCVRTRTPFPNEACYVLPCRARHVQDRCRQAILFLDVAIYDFPVAISASRHPEGTSSVHVMPLNDCHGRQRLRRVSHETRV